MSRFGILSFPGTGHLHPLTTLGRELVRRGHQVTVFQVADVEPLIRAAGLGFHQIGAREFPLGSLRPLDQTLGRLQGMRALGFIFQRFCQNSAMVLRDAPNAIRSEQIDALIVDQAEFAGGSVAERLGLPFVTAILTLPLNLDPDVPFCAFHSRFEVGGEAPARNVMRNVWIRFMASELCALVNRQRKIWGLQPKAGLDGFYSELAQIAQVPPGFDFPRRKLPAAFYYTGPFVDRAARKEISFPWSQLDSSRPLVFVSMGTLQNGIKEVYQVIAEICAEFPVQTVISLGGGLSPGIFGKLPGNPIVVRYAPQLPLLRRAALTIFHGGLNTALESLAHGVPMIAIPVAFDQPGVGARLLWTGTGKMIPIRQLTGGRLRLAMGEILSNPQYRKNARLMQKQISVINGIKRAANIIEKILERRRSSAVLRQPEAALSPLAA
jgi:zeaxanthin glucosyltransferase